ncbi:MAG: 7-carboxy-7-deazaguanine synthase QueE [Pseudomonadota bacterium]|nr:7-carboxy-7-deazaguanine synthase QueE [Pseudomonadota bacterium]
MKPAADQARSSAENPDGETRLKITEIFRSLQGESSSVGWPTSFVRLTGCPLRCQYCDTAYAFHGGQWMTIAAIVDTVRAHATRHVCVTGGEPLAQKGCLPLLSALCDAGWRVSLETSGALDIGSVDARVVRVVDIKTPGSGEVQRNRWGNLPLLRDHDEVKFVICNREDYDWACGVVREHALDRRATVLFSPSQSELPAAELADWLLADRLPVRFQMQLHKVLWGNVPGR